MMKRKENAYVIVPIVFIATFALAKLAGPKVLVAIRNKVVAANQTKNEAKPKPIELAQGGGGGSGQIDYSRFQIVILNGTEGLVNCQWFPDESALLCFDGREPEIANRKLAKISLQGTQVTGIETVLNFPPEAFDLSRDGTKLAYLKDVGNFKYAVRLLDLTRGQDIQLFPEGYNGVKISPDSTRVIFDTFKPATELWIVNVDGTGLRKLVTLEDPEDPIGCFGFSSDGAKVYFASASLDGARVVDVATLEMNIAPFCEPQFSPSGSFAIIDAGGKILRINPDGTGRMVLDQSEKIGTVEIDNAVFDVWRDPAFPSLSPDWTKIAYSVSEGDEETEPYPEEIWLMNADGTNKIKLTPRGDGTRKTKPVFSPTGRKILFSYAGGAGPLGMILFDIK